MIVIGLDCILFIQCEKHCILGEDDAAFFWVTSHSFDGGLRDQTVLGLGKDMIGTLEHFW